jgi:hypothetical protein
MRYIIDLDIPKGTDYVQIKYYPKPITLPRIVHEIDILDEDFLDVNDFKEVQTL